MCVVNHYDGLLLESILVIFAIIFHPPHPHPARSLTQRPKLCIVSDEVFNKITSNPNEFGKSSLTLENN